MNGYRLVLAMTLGAIFAGLSSPAALASPVQAIGNVATPVVALPPAWVAFAREWGDIAVYSATVTLFEQKGTQVQRSVFDYNFRKPSSATVRVIQGNNAGVTLVWNGGDTMEAHRGSGLMAIFKKTLSLHDPLATTVRGSSIDQLGFDAILAHGQQTPGTVLQGSGPTIDGVDADAVSLVPTHPETDALLTLEIVYISKETHLPVRLVAYEGPTLVRSIEFSNVKFER